MMAFSTDDITIRERVCQVKESSRPVRVERRILEKNRRNQMMNLYSKLFSLLPHHVPKKRLPLPGKIDKTIEYIKSLEAKLKKLKEEEENLIGRKRPLSSMKPTDKAGSMTQSPEIHINELGSTIQVVLVTGLDTQFVFYEIIRILQEENVDVLSVNSSTSGDSVVHAVHGEIGKSQFLNGSAKVSERLRRSVYGSIHSDNDLELELWDFERDTDAWFSEFYHN